ncbi:DNA-binding transcriptional MerR regulator [Anaerosolibacter carboniphilus]|uniref:DNA-binding transcriptional MerR regulator n=1 Tax=Anaerosolibacter carboniphilus TaxID=1417629 RepID=A0A841KPI2_9FIRM|nr:YhbD family protein [Anaerosolibacter carboniphilus]MBB6215376.1 DNA-binding transcriptional MerR regulator [Anaerosolibacter carboniphilus]
MEQALISKKELLELTGISYGQLYRWKRKNLIPEDWFIRKSTFTGQETFFPKEKILARIAKIKDMKDDLSLDDLADIFSPNLAEIILKKQELLERNVVSKTAVEVYIEKMGDTDNFTFDKILYVYILDKLLQSGEISLEEGKSLLQTMADNYKKFEGKHCELIFIRKMGISTFLLTLIPNEIYFESSTKIVTSLNLADCIEELKIKVGAL